MHYRRDKQDAVEGDNCVQVKKHCVPPSPACFLAIVAKKHWTKCELNQCPNADQIYYLVSTTFGMYTVHSSSHHDTVGKMQHNTATHTNV
jgi:hypothetical protein